MERNEDLYLKQALAMDVIDNQRDGVLLRIPCGFVQDSSIKFIATPAGFSVNSKLNLQGHNYQRS
jgi:hypothetical protein